MDRIVNYRQLAVRSSVEYHDAREQIVEKNGYAPVVINLREN